ncbi:ROK family protein [Virgibacillus sp. C22-A2]|uniref:ROK family protein n=1 Tax=Virgibacillus tibetensis TaxID=3042313 RepID=A0ABU6KE87_9BACI|nr:ROK family protein [Virgibacillus sp. C22-A2]
MLLGVIDIGGTSIKYGIVNDDGEILYHDSTPTEARLGGLEVIRKVNNLTDVLKQKWDITGFSISSAGQIDRVNGVVIYATDNIPGYTGMPIAKMVSEHTGLPVKVENDVNCTAFGEHWKGAAVGVNDFLCITIGTGIGGALFLNGLPYTGANYSAGELGHMSLYPGGKPCTCGHRGCFEQYASSSALGDMVNHEFGYPLELKDFFMKIRENDSKSICIFDQWIDDLTTGIQSLVHIFNPELIVIGGGISAQGDLLVNAIKTSLSKKIMPNHWNSLAVKLAEKDNQANLLGAAKHYLMNE